MNDKRDSHLIEYRVSQLEDAVEILADGHKELVAVVRELLTAIKTTIKLCSAMLGTVLAIVGIAIAIYK